MRTATVTAKNPTEAAKKCLDLHGFYPDTTRSVDNGDGKRAYKCFESAEDARIWDNQK